jgi:hypothetical protein
VAAINRALRFPWKDGEPVNVNTIEYYARLLLDACQSLLNCLLGHILMYKGGFKHLQTFQANAQDAQSS